MGLIIRISLRNLFRQKRRNLLLGIAIAVGIMILVIANSFSKGISDVMFNKIVTYVSGHIAIDFHEKGGSQSQIFRDKERIDKIISEVIPVYETKDEAIGVFTRAVGNGRSDNIVVVGMDYTNTGNMSPEKQKEMQESFKMVEGKWEDMKRKDIANPGVISIDKAKELNVKLGDNVRARFQNVFGQWQAVTITIVGIIKNDNIFMDTVLFIDKENLKKLMGYRPYETAAIQVNIKNPKDAKKLADKLHERLKPGLAVEYGKAVKGSSEGEATLLAFKSDDDTIKGVKSILKLTEGNIEEVTAKDGTAVAKPLADKMGIKTGDEIEYTYKNKFEGKTTTVKYKVKGIFDPAGITGDNVILVNEIKLYDTYFENLPEPVTTTSGAFLPKKEEKIYKLLATEWILLERSKSTDDLMKKMKEIGKKKWKGVTVDVNSMYESASDILKLEAALNLITLAAVLVLFFIILIGVVNTLRMTIRERTREIGTIRAVGMQKSDVRNSFIMETFFLTLFSSIIGIILAFVVMQLLSLITFNTDGNPLGMLLVRKHLHFVPTVEGILTNVLLIHVIAVITAFFPARRAANMSPSEALRHYE